MPLHWRSVPKDNLSLKFLGDIEEFFAKCPYDFYVTEGFRSVKRSNILYDHYINGIPELDANGKVLIELNKGVVRTKKKGVKAAPGGKSAHNFGMAIDVALDGDDVKPGLQMMWNTAHKGWQWLKTHSIPHPRLKNGWSFHDWPHIEVYKWKDFVNWRGVYEDSLVALKHPELYLYV